MKLFGQRPPPEIGEPLERVFKQAVERGSPGSPAVVVEDPGAAWMQVLWGLTLEQRRAVVLAARTARALEVAARWSVGGAMLLPPSTAAMSAALHAAGAAVREASWLGDPVAAAEAAAEPGALRVRPVPGAVWGRVVGGRGTAHCLSALAAVLTRPALLDRGPSLLLLGIGWDEVRAAWSRVTERPVWAGADTITVAPAGKGASGHEDEGVPVGSWPVAELPSGRVVGRWAFAAAAPTAKRAARFVLDTETGWSASDGEGRSETVAESVDPAQLHGHEGGVVRVPGWLTSDLERPGTPGAVLVGRLASEAARDETTLWLPGLSAAGVAHALRLEGRLWVDGAGVPDEGGGEAS
jgi:hypothetical protein